MKNWLLTLVACALFVSGKSYSATFDPATCPARLMVQYSEFHDASPALMERIRDGVLKIRFELEDEYLLRMYQSCLYRGNDTAQVTTGIWMYSAQFFPTGHANENRLSFYSQIYLQGKNTIGRLTLPAEQVTLTSPQSVTLHSPSGERTFTIEAEPGMSDVAYIPGMIETIGFARRVEVSVY
jgi:hypothetical protein